METLDLIDERTDDVKIIKQYNLNEIQNIQIVFHNTYIEVLIDGGYVFSMEKIYWNEDSLSEKWIKKLKKEIKIIKENK